MALSVAVDPERSLAHKLKALQDIYSSGWKENR